MAFNIFALEGNYYDDGIPRCEIEINDYRENCPLMTSLWSLDNYRNQWKIALSHLYERKVKKCMLITDINNRKISAAIGFWALYAVDENIYIREIFIRDPDKKILLNPVLVENLINSRDEDDEDEEYKPSEWKINFEDIAHLVNPYSAKHKNLHF
jgi:hypothetical protein